MVVLPITALPWLRWLPWVTVTRVTEVTVTGVGPLAVCSAVSSAGEAPIGAVQRSNEGAVRKNGALIFDATPAAAV